MKRNDMIRSLVGAALLAAGLSVLPVAAQAQQEWRAAARVNGEVITFMDLTERTRLVIFATGLPSTKENTKRLMPQVLNLLVDETLQIQEAKAHNVKVSDKDIAGALADMEQRNRLPAGGMGKYLGTKGISLDALKFQIRASIYWARLVDRRLRPQVQIGDEEIDESLERIEENQGKPLHLVSEIFLAVESPTAERQVYDSALRIVQQVRGGANFEALARAFSQSTAAASGGDLGWLRQGQLDPELERALDSMRPGQMTPPIRTNDGFHILLLRQRRLAGGATANQVTVDLRQIMLPLSPRADEAKVEAALAAAGEIRALATSCSALAAATLPGKAKVLKIGRVRVSDLAAPLQAAILPLDSNQTSDPIRTEQGAILFMVCDRDGPRETLPDREEIRRQLSMARLDLLARRYLRDLRRAAILDIRL